MPLSPGALALRFQLLPENAQLWLTMFDQDAICTRCHARTTVHSASATFAAAEVCCSSSCCVVTDSTSRLAELLLDDVEVADVHS